eukprot:1600126-Rhodomonas_salina.1
MEQLVKINLDKTKLPGCDACLRGKAHRHAPSKKQPSHSYREVMYHMHTDLSGIIQTPSIGGA